MRFSSSRLSSKSQITFPSWVKESLGVKANMDIVWIEISPGEISVLAKDSSKKNMADKLCGILKGKGADHIDAVGSLLRDREEDLKLEEKDY